MRRRRSPSAKVARAVRAGGGRRAKTGRSWGLVRGDGVSRDPGRGAGDGQSDPVGIHTHGDGVIHVHPSSHAASGPRATLGAFARTVGMFISQDTLRLPDGHTYTNGDQCGGEAGKVAVVVNGEHLSGDFEAIRLRDRDRLVIAFAADARDVPTTPPSVANLDNLSDVPQQGANDMGFHGRRMRAARARPGLDSGGKNGRG